MPSPSNSGNNNSNNNNNNTSIQHFLSIPSSTSSSTSPLSHEGDRSHTGRQVRRKVHSSSSSSSSSSLMSDSIDPVLSAPSSHGEYLFL
jgi:hypothetical protein